MVCGENRGLCSEKLAKCKAIWIEFATKLLLKASFTKGKCIYVGVLLETMTYKQSTEFNEKKRDTNIK